MSNVRDISIAADLARIQHWSAAGGNMPALHYEKGPEFRYGDGLEGLDPSGGVVGMWKLAVVLIPAAELLDLFANPVVVVDAAPTGYANVLHACVIQYDAGDTAYTIGTATDLVVKMKADGSGAAVTVALDSTGFIDSATDLIVRLKCVATNDTLLTGADSALALTIGVASPTDGTGVLRVTSLYSQIKLY